MHRKLILDKIKDVLSSTDASFDKKLTHLLDGADRIFIAGAGRSALVARFFAMRLMHGGYNVYIVGEIVTPSLQKGDLLIVISGSGETEALIGFTKRAVSIGAGVALICSKESSTIGDLAGQVFTIGSQKDYTKTLGMPMGTTFELSTLVALEAVVSHLIHEKGIAEEVMRTRHANLE